MYCDQLLKVQDARRNGITGYGVKVAVVDSGFEKTGVVAGFLDVWDRRNRTETDKLGHGTAMANIILDIAPDAEIHSVRISEGTRLKLWNAMLGIAAASFEFDADIINLSFGLSTSILCPQCGLGVSNCPNCGHDLPVISHTLESFLDGIVRVDVGKTGPPIIVSATGNKGHKGVDKPADYGLSVAVGSINRGLSRSPFSNYDPSHSQFIVMPGGDEDDHQQATEWVGEGSQGKCLGTSPATAYASAILALYLSDKNYNDADRAAFLKRVLSNCDDTWSTYNSTEHGKGYLPYIP
jgi:subtilisin family serine protease